MAAVNEWTLQSSQGGNRYVREWPNATAGWIALLCHGYGEHISRYDHVADALAAAICHANFLKFGAAVSS